MRILISPNAYKGSLTAFTAAQAIRTGLRLAMTEASLTANTTGQKLRATDIQTEQDGQVSATPVSSSQDAPELICLPLADGGDGTLETLVQTTGGTLHTEINQLEILCV